MVFVVCKCGLVQPVTSETEVCSQCGEQLKLEKNQIELDP